MEELMTKLVQQKYSLMHHLVLLWSFGTWVNQLRKNGALVVMNRSIKLIGLGKE